MAPEIIQKVPGGNKVDNWGLGILIYELGFLFILSKRVRRTSVSWGESRRIIPKNFTRKHYLPRLLVFKCERFSIQAPKKRLFR